MKRFLAVIVAVVALGACVTVQSPLPEPLAIGPAPVSYDGHIAGQATDLVFVLVPNADPTVAGLALEPGDSLGVMLPAAFRRNDQVVIRTDADANLVLTKGWPQARSSRRVSTPSITKRRATPLVSARPKVSRPPAPTRPGSR